MNTQSGKPRQPTLSNDDAWVVGASWFVASVPPALMIVVTLSAAYIRLSFGRWPVVSRDSVSVPFVEAVVMLTANSLLALGLSILLLPIVVAGRALSGIRPVLGRWALCFTIGWLTALFLIRWDPTGFIDWLLG
jgi:hypothetical protein